MNNLLTVTIFLALGAGFVALNLTLGRFLRPRLPSAQKAAPYECGEKPLAESWVQFDLRFYVVALIFLVFDVEVALFYPWAAVFRSARLPALIDALVFFAVLLVGFVYLWRFDYLDWVRLAKAQAGLRGADPVNQPLRDLARKDPELLEDTLSP